MNVFVLKIAVPDETLCDIIQNIYFTKGDAIREIYDLYDPKHTKSIWDLNITEDEFCVTINARSKQGESKTHTYRILTYEVQGDPSQSENESPVQQPEHQNIFKRIFSRV